MEYNGQPLTVLIIGKKNRITFALLGDDSYRTQVYNFMDSRLESEKEKNAIMGIFSFIDETFPNCSHEKKFKKFEGQSFWEIKSGQIRIACVWHQRTLICFYGCIKKDTKWSKRDKANALQIYRNL